MVSIRIDPVEEELKQLEILLQRHRSQDDWPLLSLESINDDCLLIILS